MSQTSGKGAKNPVADKKAAVPAEELRPDLCVIGSDPAGIELAFAAAGLGARVALVTQEEGDLTPDLVRIRALGGQILTGKGEFLDPKRFAAENRTLRARTFALATGAEPIQPAIPGVAAIPLWDASIHGIDDCKDHHVLVIGGGPSGALRAMTARMRGCAVTLVAPGRFLPEFDFEAAAIVATDFARHGIPIHENLALQTGAIRTDEAGAMTISFAGASGPLPVTHRIDDCGILPVLGGLQVEKAGINLRDGHLVLDHALRTTNRRILAVGAATGDRDSWLRKSQHVSTALAAALFGKPVPIRQDLRTRLCFSAPPIAEVGLTEGDIAAGTRSSYRFYRAAYTDSSRVGAENIPASHIKVITTRKGLIRGVSIVGERAPELIVPFVQAMADSKPLQTLASLPIAGHGPAEAIRSVARLALLDSLRGSWWLKLMRLLGLTRFTGSARLGGG